ncbi:hypothetical protein [Rhabdaerophilum sp.]|uniref:hypothetical protein n=1 Tax=Rhabdaerophilum sp. TaxID=2717341 RepID=UPI0038D4853C
MMNTDDNLRDLQQRGLPAEVLLRIGAFAVRWTTFEHYFEMALWRLNGELVEGQRPSTDTTSISRWVQDLGEPRPDLSADANRLLSETAKAVEDLVAYRHALFHGAPLLFDESAVFIRNPAWFGEKRKRETSKAHVDTHLLDMALEALHAVTRVVIWAFNGAEQVHPQAVAELTVEIRKARLTASVLRHLDDVMNNEMS